MSVSKLTRYRTDRAVIYAATHPTPEPRSRAMHDMDLIVNCHLARAGEADRSEQIGEQVLSDMQDIALSAAELARRAPVTLRDFMSPGAWADRQAKHRAVRNVLSRFEPSMVVTEELLDELIAAADTGI